MRVLRRKITAWLTFCWNTPAYEWHEWNIEMVNKNETELPISSILEIPLKETIVKWNAFNQKINNRKPQQKTPCLKVYIHGKIKKIESFQICISIICIFFNLPSQISLYRKQVSISTWCIHNGFINTNVDNKMLPNE